MCFCSALHRDVPLTNACNVLGILLSGEYFFVIAFASFLSVTALALLALSFEQCLNIGRNIVRTAIYVFLFLIYLFHLRCFQCAS